MIPVVVLVGRPNVGKSTLFNRLTRSRDALVSDFPGLTRDRHYGRGRWGQREFIVVDTGGLEPDAAEGIVHAMAVQTRQAVAEADVVVFLVDARAGLSAHDHDIAGELRRLGKSVVLAVNKAEGLQGSPKLAEFYELGLGAAQAISAAHGSGMQELVSAVQQALGPAWEPAPEAESEPSDVARPMRLAVAGRPNVGKSTLINTWLGEQRLVTYDQPGTTRDAITIPFRYRGQDLELVDTAGLRRRGKVFETVEKFSVIKTLQAIEKADVVVLMIDALEGVTDQDARIAGFVLESGRAVVVAVNKWDAADDYRRELTRRSLEARLRFLEFAQVHHISATRRQGLGPLWRSILQAWRAARLRMPTPRLTRLLHEAVQQQAPRRSGMYRPKLRYAHQGGVQPPVIVVHGNSLEGVTPAYRRYLENHFRRAFQLTGTPLRIELRSGHNPYVQKKRG